MPVNIKNTAHTHVVLGGRHARPSSLIPEGTYVCLVVGWSERIPTKDKGGMGWFRALDLRIAEGPHVGRSLELKAFSHLYSQAKRRRMVSVEKVALAIAGRDAVIESPDEAESVIERAVAEGNPAFQAVVKWRIFDTVQYDNLCASSWGNKRARATRWGRKHLTRVDDDGQPYTTGVNGQRIYPTAEVTSVRPLRKSKRPRGTAAPTPAGQVLYSAARRTTIGVAPVEGGGAQ